MLIGKPAGCGRRRPDLRITAFAMFVLSFGMLLQCTSTPNPVKDDPPTPTTTETTEPKVSIACLGVDVSHHSGTVDWATVKAEGYHFAFTKATEGVDWVDPMLIENLRGIKQAGMVRGAYHFYVVGDDPNDQAQNFIKHTPLDPGDFIPVVDIETANHKESDMLLAGELRLFLDALEQHYGVTPAIYTGLNFWKKHLGSDDFSRYPLWIAQYEVTQPTLPEPWTGYWLWQSAQDQAVGGIEKGADLNTCSGDHEAVLQKTLR